MISRSIIFFFTIFLLKEVTPLILENGNVTLNMEITPDNGILIEFSEGGVNKLSGRIGIGMQFELYDASRRLFAASDAEFSVTDVLNGFTIYWESVSDKTQVFQDCFELNRAETDWFIGRQGNPTEWPIQNSKFAELPYVVKDSESIAEPYWLSSKGVFLFVNETTPLYVDQNNLVDDNLCFLAKIADPYNNRSRVILNYTLGAAENAREAHWLAVKNYLGTPTGTPDMTMIREPVWPTWTHFQTDFNSKLLYSFAESIHANDFRGQVEIQDGWEDCYGSLTFDKKRFADIMKTVMDIQSFAFRVTLWIHPFVNENCTDIVREAREKRYFVKDSNGDDMTSWWNGQESHLIDFTNQEAKEWFIQRVTSLVSDYRLDGVRFDAGEVSFAPSGAVFKGDAEKEPNEFTYYYNSLSNVSTTSKARSGWRTQWVPVFITIPDKESNWSLENGLKSVLINLMQLNIAGYTIVSPGLIGGKSEERPSAELFVRWLQAVTFMPVLEFGYLPWEFYSPTFDVMNIVKKYVDLHYWYSDYINNVIKKCKSTGLPVNAPVWWIDPTNPDAFKITDQYMLGERFLIAPVLEEGVVSRDIYLPPGTWEDGNDPSKTYEGNTILKDYPAPIDVLPYFTKPYEP